MAFSKFAMSACRGFAPYVWNGLAASGLFIVADLSQQALERRPVFDFRSACRMGIVGACMAPLRDTWHQRMEMLFPGTGRVAVTQKVLLTTGVAGAVFTFLFYTLTSIVEHKEDIFAEARQKWTRTYMTSWIYWPFVNVVGFCAVPIHYRSLYASIFGFVWTIILCMFKHQQLSLQAVKRK